VHVNIVSLLTYLLTLCSGCQLANVTPDRGADVSSAWFDPK